MFIIGYSAQCLAITDYLNIATRRYIYIYIYIYILNLLGPKINRHTETKAEAINNW